MNSIDLKTINNLEDLLKLHHNSKEKSIECVKSVTSVSVDNSYFLDYVLSIEKKITELFAEYITNWNEVSNKSLRVIKN
jgi:hypothetical protein